MIIDLEQIIAVFRFLPLPIAFYYSLKYRQILPAVITVIYAAVILFGNSFLRWEYSVAVLSTPLSYLLCWYIIKTVRMKKVVIITIKKETKLSYHTSLKKTQPRKNNG